jgi:hypothetical protein
MLRLYLLQRDTGVPVLIVIPASGDRFAQRTLRLAPRP